MSSPRNFLLSTDYPTDLIAFLKSGSVTVPPWDGVSIAHGLNFTPLCMGSFSLSSSFSSSRDFGIALYSPDLSLELYSNSTHIKIESTHWEDVHIHYRILGFAPSDYTGEVSPPATNTPWALNTDFNYMKIHKKGILHNVSSTQVVHHGLGYKPMVLAWRENANGTYREYIADTDGTYKEINITDTEVRFKSGGNTIPKIHYRIYHDD